MVAGRLFPIHRGVYAVGHPALSQHGSWMAAVLACGPGAALSHRSAAELWSVLEAGRSGGPIHVTLPASTGRRKRRGIHVHRSSTLSRSSVTSRDGVPVTTPRRTLEDLRPHLSPSGLRDAVRKAEWLRLPVGDLSLLTQRTASELELLFLQLCRRHELPEPEVNVRIGRFKVDFLWRRDRLVVETDGRRAHGGPAATEADLLRDARLTGMGFEVRRMSYADVIHAPARVVADLRRALSGSRVAG